MSLYSRIIDMQKLDMAWRRVYKNKPSAGVDNISAEQFHENRKAELKQLNIELKEHRYETLPVKKIMLYKGEKAREIALYSMRDKVVQQSIATELNKMYDASFSDATYAYRNGRSALNAINLLTEQMQSGRWSFVLKLDISKFFDRIRWENLEQILKRRISEEDVLELIHQDTQAMYIEETGELVEKELGIYQGSGLSPILSNIYLMDFDSWLSGKDIYFVRYSDDMLLLGRTKDQLLGLLAEIQGKLAESGLQVNEKKLILVDCKGGVDFLGYHLSSDGKTIPKKAQRSLQERLELMWLTSSNISLQDKIKKANEIIGGWEQYFREERRQISIFEYVSLVSLAGENKEKIDRLVKLRPEINNIYKDILLYLADYWASGNNIDLELLEYEQFFQIYKRNGEISASVSFKKEMLALYRKLVIQETEADLVELMQLYSDVGEYEKAAFWMQRKEQGKTFSKKMSESILHTENRVGDEFIWDKKTVAEFLKHLVGREDIHALESLEEHHHRKNEFQSIPFTEQIVEKHLAGYETVATYIQRSNSTAKHLIIDVDISKKIIMQYGQSGEHFEGYLEKTRITAWKIKNLLHQMGMESYIEFSGYRGYHVWVFFTEWIPVRYINMLTDVIDGKLAEKERQAEEGAQAGQEISIEYFPNKTRLKPGKYGQAIKLPYGIHSKTGQRSYFLEEDGSKIIDISLFLDTIAKTSLNALKRVLAGHTDSRGNESGSPSYDGQKQERVVDEDLSAFDGCSANALEILKKCNLMRYLCQKSVKTGYLTHFERLSVLYVFGHLGEEGKEFVHKVMVFTLNYRNYSEPHSQNRLFKAFLLLMWLLRHINLLFCLNASIRRKQICMALNSYKLSI